MKSKLAALLSILFVAPLMAGFVPAASAQTLPDTDCLSAVGVGAPGPGNPAHAYYTANGVVTFANDACPDHYSGELGVAVGGTWLFSREGPSANGGDGVVACYGSTDPTAGPTTGHHGADTTIAVRDDVLGGAVAFTVTRDYNRSADNPFLPVGNDLGDFDCGDNLVEPCGDDPNEYTTAPGCNPLDASEFQFPATGLCTGISDLGDLLNPPTDPTLIDLLLAFILSLLGIVNGDANCVVPPVNKWTAPGTLADFAGADGAVVLFFSSNVRFDAGHFGTGTTGAVWTQDNPAAETGGCVLSPGTDTKLFTCTYTDKSGCTWIYRANDPQPRQPDKVPPSDDIVISKICA